MMRSITLGRHLAIFTLASVSIAALMSASPASAADDPTAFSPGPPACLDTPWYHLNTQKAQSEFQVPSGELQFGDHLYRIQRRFTQPVFNSVPRLWIDACANMPTQQVVVFDKLSTLTVLDGEVATFKASTVIHKTGQPWREIRGAINDKYNQLGGWLFYGFPVTSETPTPNKLGAFNHFEGGRSIYWSPSTGAHEVHGAIRREWASLGWENSYLGFPVTDETMTPDKPGAFNHFEGGSIYRSPSTGAHAVHGAIRDKWASLGWENSYLGFPTSDEYAIPGGRRQTFQSREHYPSQDYFTMYGIDWTPTGGARVWSNTIPYF
jgi:uncharacterized protein with LGFP repeats